MSLHQLSTEDGGMAQDASHEESGLQAWARRQGDSGSSEETDDDDYSDAASAAEDAGRDGDTDRQGDGDTGGDRQGDGDTDGDKQGDGDGESDDEHTYSDHSYSSEDDMYAMTRKMEEIEISSSGSSSAAPEVRKRPLSTPNDPQRQARRTKTEPPTQRKESRSEGEEPAHEESGSESESASSDEFEEADDFEEKEDDAVSLAEDMAEKSSRLSGFDFFPSADQGLGDRHVSRSEGFVHSNMSEHEEADRLYSSAGLRSIDQHRRRRKTHEQPRDSADGHRGTERRRSTEDRRSGKGVGSEESSRSESERHTLWAMQCEVVDARREVIEREQTVRELRVQVEGESSCRMRAETELRRVQAESEEFRSRVFTLEEEKKSLNESLRREIKLRSEAVALLDSERSQLDRQRKEFVTELEHLQSHHASRESLILKESDDLMKTLLEADQVKMSLLREKELYEKNWKAADALNTQTFQEQHRLNQENAKLKNQLAQLKLQYTQWEELCKTAEMELRRKLRAKETELANHVCPVVEKVIQSEPAEYVDRLEQERELRISVETEFAKRCEEVNQLKRYCGQLEDHLATCLGSRHEVEKTRRPLFQKIESLESEVMSLRSQLDDAYIESRRSSEKARHDAMGMADVETQALKENLENLRSLNVDLELAKTSLTEEVRQLQFSCDRLIVEKDEAERRSVTVERSVATLTVELDERQREASQLGQELRDTLTKLQESAYMCRTEVSRKLLLEGQMEREATRTKYLADEIVRLSSESEKSKSHARGLEREVSDLQRQLAEAQSRMAQLNAELNRQTLQTTQYKADIANLHEDLNRVKRQRNDSRSGLEEALTTVRRWMSEAGGETEKAKERIADLEKKNEDLSKLLQSVDERHDERVKHLQEELAIKLREADQVLKREKFAWESRSHALETQSHETVKKLESMIQTRDLQLSQLEKSLQDLRTKAAETSARLTDSSAKLTEYASKLNEANLKLREANGKVTESEGKVKQAETESKRLQVELQKQQQELQRVQTSKPSAQDAMLRQRAEVIAARDQQIKLLETETEKLKADLATKSAGDAKHKQELDLLNAKLQAANQLQNEVDSVTMQLESLKKANVLLRQNSGSQALTPNMRKTLHTDLTRLVLSSLASIEVANKKAQGDDTL